MTYLPHCATATTALDWDTDLLQVAIETEIAEEAEISIQTIRVALDAELDGRELDIPAVRTHQRAAPS